MVLEMAVAAAIVTAIITDEGTLSFESDISILSLHREGREGCQVAQVQVTDQSELAGSRFWMRWRTSRAPYDERRNSHSHYNLWTFAAKCRSEGTTGGTGSDEEK